jgi:hypothetical protein
LIKIMSGWRGSRKQMKAERRKPTGTEASSSGRGVKRVILERERLPSLGGGEGFIRKKA